jgi:hypothetical protein
LCRVPSRLVAPIAAAFDHRHRHAAFDSCRRSGSVEKHLPEQYRRKPPWRHVSSEIAKAAEGETDLLEVCVSLRLVLALEGVECLMK